VLNDRLKEHKMTGYADMACPQRNSMDPGALRKKRGIVYDEKFTFDLPGFR
jgi:hypothetical protein